MACAASEDSDQPGHPPTLTRVFAVHMKKDWVLSYPMSAQQRLNQTGRMPRLIWVFTGCTVILLEEAAQISFSSSTSSEFTIKCIHNKKVMCYNTKSHDTHAPMREQLTCHMVFHTVDFLLYSLSQNLAANISHFHLFVPLSFWKIMWQ